MPVLMRKLVTVDLLTLTLVEGEAEGWLEYKPQECKDVIQHG